MYALLLRREDLRKQMEDVPLRPSSSARAIGDARRAALSCRIPWGTVARGAVFFAEFAIFRE
ncbi:hypothetical protein COU20_00235 [Candidatus Kaiserbacteria bacterium CG10_big_fil_rev_8_21_14_0_10_59_10]|uniref:Uncharacterized protein n=1 Tax=Candidatus Kaiserbacteria bacterium CG10_big_fil_rev_8_21_14_0_10_59_10 TaxID=1974612 RepID=A0A2H0U8V4_9BACT|nr:MAG: hypothetical protein COU20_00235 [Candidatus Kaiserbacteria bacterium CG10_big_fil_rev_8_21_14_0_10_59_10]